MRACPLWSTGMTFGQTVPKDAPVDEYWRSGPSVPWSANARYAANPKASMIGVVQAPSAWQLGSTNIGILRTTPSESGARSVEARMTLGFGVAQGALALLDVSAHRNMRIGI
jgi:hypothetical protein